MKMFSHVLKRVIFDTVQNGTKSFSTSCQRDSKVTVIGAAGGVGQPLSLLLKLNSLVTHLSLYDVVPLTCGVATDLSHINTPATVSGHKDPELHSALQCANLVIMAAGVPRKPGMTRDDLFNTNASIVANASACVAQVCPKAIVAIITNPLNSMVPVACEVLRKAGVYDPKRVLGVTTLDLVRASTFVGQINKVNPESINVPVIGGHSGITIVPVLSQSNPLLQLADRGQILALIKRIQEAGTEVVQAKAGGGSATLSTAFAAARISCAILRGLRGDPNVIDSAYVESKLCKATEYFASALLFGKNGVEKNLPYGTLNEVEQGLLELAIPELVKNIKKGKEFITKQKH